MELQLRLPDFADLARSLYPSFCLLCDARIDHCSHDHHAADLLCPRCREELPWLPKACHRCAAPLDDDSSELCSNCVSSPPPQQRTHCLFHYQPPIDHLIGESKFHGQLHVMTLLGQLLAEAMVERAAPSDQLLPMPLHPRRLRERGFNQAKELARPAARRLRLPIAERTLRRHRYTQPQAELNAAARRRNIRGAFRVSSRRVPRRILLIDDVITTGSTVSEAAKVLRRAGCESVEVWAIARADD